MEYIKLIGGLVLLVAGGNYLVKGGVALARHFNISTLVIGVTVVSFGTSAPELIVSLQAALDGHPDISIGNVVGSNISNISLVLALTAILLPLTINRYSVRYDWSFMMLTSILFYFFIFNENGFSESGGNIVARWEGIIMILLLIAYIIFSIKKSRNKTEIPLVAATNESKLEKEGKPAINIWLATLMILASCAGLFFGAVFLIDGAVEIATRFGVSDRIISVTIVAFGTSVPELATSIMAAIKKEMDISVGNIIGSNIFNILAILGITSVIKEIPVNPGTVRFDFIWVLGISLLLLICMMPLRKPRIGRIGGFIMLITYFAYVYLVFNSGISAP